MYVGLYMCMRVCVCMYVCVCICGWMREYVSQEIAPIQSCLWILYVKIWTPSPMVSRSVIRLSLFLCANDMPRIQAVYIMSYIVEWNTLWCVFWKMRGLLSLLHLLILQALCADIQVVQIVQMSCSARYEDHLVCDWEYWYWTCFVYFVEPSCQLCSCNRASFCEYLGYWVS